MSKGNYNLEKVIRVLFVIAVFFTTTRSPGLAKAPGNAALLYYQAFLLQPEPDKATFWSLEEVTQGADPNESVREYLKGPFSRAAIELAQNATQIPSCDWGPLYPGGYGENALVLPLRRLCTLMQVHARELGAKGDFRSAFESCIGIQRLAGHTGDKTFLMYSTSRTINRRALICIGHILGSMPADVETLTWLKGQIVPSHVAPSQIIEILESNCNLHLQFMWDHPNAYLHWWKEYPQAIEDPNARKKILESASKLYNQQLQSALKVFESNLPYERKKAEVQRLIARDDNHFALILGDCVPYIESCYDVAMRDTATFNVLTAALDIYLVAARTGHIPKTLPPDQATDPYTGKELEYRVTNNGFALRYRDSNRQSGASRWWEFTKIAKIGTATY